MSDDNENAKINMGGAVVTLADLAGANLDDFAEKRGDSFPKGYFAWEVEGGEHAPCLKAIGEGDKAKGGAVFRLKCLEVLTVTDNEFTGDQNELIGKFHNETLFLGDADGLGYLKAFLKDIGCIGTGDLNSRLASCAGLRFEGFIVKRKNKDDSDIVYTNINRNKGKIKPIAGAAVSNVAQAAA